MGRYPSEQKLSYADFKALCKTYCGNQTAFDTSKVVGKCWSCGFWSGKKIGYRFKCQCVGSRESMRIEGCGVPPYYDAPDNFGNKPPTGNSQVLKAPAPAPAKNSPGAAKNDEITRIVTDEWPKIAQNGKTRTRYDTFQKICKLFCDEDNNYYTKRNDLSGLKFIFNTTSYSVLTTKRSPGHLFNCTCKTNKDERLSVSEGL